MSKRSDMVCLACLNNSVVFLLSRCVLQCKTSCLICTCTESRSAAKVSQYDTELFDHLSTLYYKTSFTTATSRGIIT